MSLGNDVVDLNSSDADVCKIHPRFVERILSRLEFAFFVENFQSKPTMLWTYWAAKESAYKALSKPFPDITFAYKAFEFDYLRKKVTYQHYTLSCEVDQQENYVHVTSLIATQGNVKNPNQKAPYQKAVFHKKNIFPEVSQPANHMEGSLLLRQKLIQDIAKKNNYCQEHLKIKTLSKESRVPYLFYKNRQQSVAFSLSHHGDYLAYAFELNAYGEKKK